MQTTANRRKASLGLALAAVIFSSASAGFLLATRPDPTPATDAAKADPANVDRSPVDVVLTKDEKWLLTANQTSNTVSLVETTSGKVVAEVPCGNRPSAVVLTPDESKVLVSGTYSGDLTVFNLKSAGLVKAGSVRLMFEPRGIAVSPDGKLAYVALTSANAVAVVDIEKLKLIKKIKVGTWPRYLALTPDGKRLAVNISGDGGVAVIDTEKRKVLFSDWFNAINVGHMQVSADGKHVYFPWMIYRANPITANNIRIGWVLGSRIARLRMDQHERREALTLDPRGEAVADPHGIALSPDEQWLICAASGTQELLVYKLPTLPFATRGGTDHIDSRLLRDNSRFYRIRLGGRPMSVRYSSDGKHAFVANYMLNAVQVVDVPGRKVVRTIDLGGPEEQSLARKGEAIFYDGRRSLDQWYSCHSCHYEGHTNSLSMDTLNDGRFGNFKTVLSLRNVTKTAPWTWHGWQKDLGASIRKSLKDTMLSEKQTTDEDVKAVLAFFGTLGAPANPYRKPDGSLTEAAKRGEKVFRSAKANCSQCHAGEYFTKDRIYDVGLGEQGDRYKGYNPPSLISIYDRVFYLHDGRASSLEELLTNYHAPHKVTGRGKLTGQERKDLVEYLKSL